MNKRFRQFRPQLFYRLQQYKKQHFRAKLKHYSIEGEGFDEEYFCSGPQ